MEGLVHGGRAAHSDNARIVGAVVEAKGRLIEWEMRRRSNHGRIANKGGQA